MVSNKVLQATAQNPSTFIQTLSTLHHGDALFRKGVSMHKHKKADVIATTKAMENNLYILVHGEVKLIYTNTKGRRIVMATLKPGAIFGEGALVTHAAPNAFAEASSDSDIWTIPASSANTMMLQYPILSWALLQTYGERLVQVENSLEDVAYKTLPARLATLLLARCDKTTGVVNDLSHQLLADHLGTYRETISAILRDFKHQGFVQLGYRRITIVDEDALAEIGDAWEW
jgi:CRP-like cAMP-binding protein